MKLADWIGLLCLILALLILWQFRQIVLLIFTAVILAIALNSLVRWLQRFRLKRSIAVIVALSLVVFFGTLFFSLVMPPFLTQFQQLIELAPRGFNQFIRWVDNLLENPPLWLPEQYQYEFQIPTIPEIAQQIGPLAQNVLGNFFAFFSNSVTTLLQVLLVIVLTLMFLANPLAYRQLFVRLFPSFYRRRADHILSGCETALLLWMGGIVINSIFIASLSAVGLFILGIPFVFAHALLAGVFNLIPNLGPAASVIFPVSVALLDAPWKALTVIILYIVIQNLESYWFSPMIMQKQVSLLPAATLTAQIFFASFFGFLGLVLALPLAVVSKIWIEEAIMKDILDQWHGTPEKSFTETSSEAFTDFELDSEPFASDSLSSIENESDFPQ
ncbi:AI-2E family transporter [Capilliphycus salinus ALCB114379]|uniref:AI-2E family transporter n=1 Tax=Capilliphycus salinus TaxID=2768948 RepID=UPI0039A5E63F